MCSTGASGLKSFALDNQLGSDRSNPADLNTSSLTFATAAFEAEGSLYTWWQLVGTNYLLRLDLSGARHARQQA